MSRRSAAPAATRIWTRGFPPPSPGSSLGEEGRARLRRDRIGFVFQSFHLIPRLSAGGEIRRPLVLPGVEAGLEAPEPVATTAAALGLSPRRLEQLFRDNLAMTPAAYALTLRLQAARRFITDTRHPLAEVALRCGFSSASALSRAFAAKFGQPPSQMRQARPFALRRAPLHQGAAERNAP